MTTMKYLENNPLGYTWDGFLARGYKMFIAARLASTEVEHCERYYQFMGAPVGAVLVDMGCGVGGFGVYMQEIDPGIQVINVVNDPALIAEMQAAGRYCVEASYENTPLPGAVADVVTFNESIGYGDLDRIFREATRVMKPGAALIIKDFAPTSTADQHVFQDWGYTLHKVGPVVVAAHKQGLQLDRMEVPEMYTAHWPALAEEHKAGVMVLYRFSKVGVDDQATN